MVRWRGKPFASIPEGFANDTPLPPEAVFLPVLAFLFAMLVSYPALAQYLGKVGPADAADEDKLDLAALVANNLAFVAAAVVSYVVGRRYLTRTEAGFVRGGRGIASQVLFGVGGAIAAIALCQLTLYVTVRIVQLFKPEITFPEHGVIEALRNPQCPVWLPAFLWAGVAGVTPIAEEMYFRGILQTGLIRTTRSRRWGVVVAGFMFGLAHATQPQVVPALALFGVILGVMYVHTGSLVGPIVAHAVFNAKTLVWETLLLHYN
ncbi:MAG: CPBP family intramembrane metalloprotease [Phycisphaerales bacterium]|nr:CPBP family intramembrane metalloprotease [Phycisphaerales bacterium]